MFYIVWKVLTYVGVRRNYIKYTYIRKKPNSNCQNTWEFNKNLAYKNFIWDAHNCSERKLK